MKVVLFDTETTGGGPRDRLIQLAVKERGVKEPVVNALYKPPLPISFDSMAVHHITEKMVEDRPFFPESEEFASIKELLEHPETVAVAHNAPFDIAMLEREGVQVANAICTYKSARALDPEGAIKNYRLQYLRYRLGLDVDATAHDAWGDVLVLEALFERLMEKAVEEGGTEDAAIKRMIADASAPTLFSTFPFGKYKGKKVADVAKEDAGYLEWLLGQKKQDPLNEADWIHTLEHHLGAADDEQAF